MTLFISREGESDTTKQSLPKDPGNPGFDRTTPTTHFTNTELRYELIQSPSVNMFLGAGVRIKIPFEEFIRSRISYTRHLGKVSLMNLGETFFLNSSTGLGETTEISLERLYAPGTILRWASSGTVSHYIDGLEWGSELSLIQGISPRSAVTVTGGVYGNTTTSLENSSFRIRARFRQNFFRKWLFYELEPEIDWQRNDDGNYPATLAFTFRLEVVFQKTAAPKDIASSLPSETSDKPLK
jgi:hypothetical protein